MSGCAMNALEESQTLIRSGNERISQYESLEEYFDATGERF